MKEVNKLSLPEGVLNREFKMFSDVLLGNNDNRPFNYSVVTNMEKINILNVKKPTIDSHLLITLSQSGRNILAYIIDKKMTGDNWFTVDKVDMINYLAEKISKPYANTLNVNRGIRDLIEAKVISKISGNDYSIDINLLSK